ncbi:hypothetical protein OIU76_008295 [Salix suchowensis]|nr:hypothetical protein OIU76_008295 [Salix suchowensis]
MHCFVGPAVLRWKSFYETQDDAWKAHYQEVFDHGIHEALCCLGRAKYMGAPKEDEGIRADYIHAILTFIKLKDFFAAGSKKVDHSYSLWNELDRTNNGGDTDNDNFENPFNDKAAVMNSLADPVSQFLETVPRSENGSAGNEAEMFLPGLVIHMVPQRRYISTPLWKGWSVQESVQNYDAYLANIEIFKDIVVSPNMFF